MFRNQMMIPISTATMSGSHRFTKSSISIAGAGFVAVAWVGDVDVIVGIEVDLVGKPVARGWPMATKRPPAKPFR
jgi:hypothetical protein